MEDQQLGKSPAQLPSSAHLAGVGSRLELEHQLPGWGGQGWGGPWLLPGNLLGCLVTSSPGAVRSLWRLPLPRASVLWDGKWELPPLRAWTWKLAVTSAKLRESDTVNPLAVRRGGQIPPPWEEGQSVLKLPGTLLRQPGMPCHRLAVTSLLASGMSSYSSCPAPAIPS